MSKEAYHTLCRTEESIPLFSRDWWLDAVCGKANWTALLIEENNRVQAAWPLYLPRPRLVTMPPYTRATGIWFAPASSDTKYASLLEHRQNLCKQLIGQLRIRSFQQNFPCSFTDWLPFYWEGFRQTTRYTYLLHDLKDTEQCWLRASQNIRRNITRAREKYRLTVRKGIPVDDFLRVQSLTFERQQQKNRQPESVLRRLIDVCRERQQGDLWGGYDDRGRLHAAVFIAWQPQQAACYMAGGGDPSLRASGAHSLIMWEAIRYVSDFCTVFDFEGSMLPGVERFFRQFGGIQTPYFNICKGTPTLLDKVILKLDGFRRH
ncbi:MAG: GNAT family N-acetyltransferase [Tannerella sp.]|jgi:hypothetical protein|nr:GNAT family N-acetyltransferase [Tannerella sp.]